ncbi:sulfite exporter TauE/SafE family protein [Lederbergia graminis]|uniref:Probable membrane transporter protein n=1 Tax=Lederbergia graminis TaxID=735518 RepID=A0ABW0LLL9_9BACI
MFIFSFLSIFEWFLSAIIGIFIGFSKTGISTIGIFNVSLLVQIFPAKESVGVMLPMLIIGDIIAVSYYRKAVVWRYLLQLIPWVLIGILAGFVVLWKVSGEEFQLVLGILILCLIVFQFVNDFYKKKELKLFSSKTTKVFGPVMGILAGFATMIGNVSGVIMAIYLFSKGLPKKEFIGTGAWFFLAVNLIKIPFYIHIDIITVDSLKYNVMMIPFIGLGAFIGIKLIPLIPQKVFQVIVLVLGALGAIALISPKIF